MMAFTLRIFNSFLQTYGMYTIHLTFTKYIIHAFTIDIMTLTT